MTNDMASGGASLLAQRAGGLTVDSAFRARVKLHPAAPAVEQDGRTLSYAQLHERVCRLSRVLVALGVRRHDRVAVLSENRHEYLELQLACASVGATLACQNWRQSKTELEHCVRLAEPCIGFVSARHADKLVGIEHGCRRIVGFGEEYEALLARAEARAVVDQAEPEDGLLLLYTSGTTGLPKGALISHRAEVARAMIGLVDGQFYRGRGTIIWAPMYHIGGTDQALGMMMLGERIFITDGFDPAALVEIMARADLGNVQLMPAAIGRVIDELKRSGLRPRSLMSCGGMADLVPRHQIAEVSGLLNAEFRNTFGATETGQPPASRSRFAAGVVPQRMSKEQSSFCDIRLVDEDDNEVPDGQPGEVAIRGPFLFSGYWRAPEVNTHDFRGGWFHMGDVMVRNPDGTLDFVDRRKYLIKSGGENIYPAEIEQILLSNERVADAVIVRRPDDHWGEVPVAFVVPNDALLRPEDVIAMCRGRVANYKLPKAVRFIAHADLPRSETGKIKRAELEALLRAELASNAKDTP